MTVQRPLTDDLHAVRRPERRDRKDQVGRQGRGSREIRSPTHGGSRRRAHVGRQISRTPGRARPVRGRHVLDVGEVGGRPRVRRVARQVVDVQSESLRSEEGEVHLEMALGHIGREASLVDPVRPLERIDRWSGVPDAPCDRRDRDGPGRRTLPRSSNDEAPDQRSDEGGGEQGSCATVPSSSRRPRAGQLRLTASPGPRPLPNDPVHDRAGEIRDLLGRADPHRRADPGRSLLECPTPSATHDVHIRCLRLASRQVDAVHPRRDKGLHAFAVHVPASSSAIAAQSACRARNIRLFTVPTATPSTSAAS